MVESPGFPAADTPAALEFALLEAWLASTGALQLPLHEIEPQQQTKGISYAVTTRILPRRSVWRTRSRPDFVRPAKHARFIVTLLNIGVQWLDADRLFSLLRSDAVPTPPFAW